MTIQLLRYVEQLWPLNTYLIMLYMYISSEMTNLTRMHNFQNRIHFSGTLFDSDFKNHSPSLQNIDCCNVFNDVQNYLKYFFEINGTYVGSVSFFKASSKIIVPASKTINFVKMLIFKVAQKLFHVQYLYINIYILIYV